MTVGAGVGFDQLRDGAADDDGVGEAGDGGGVGGGGDAEADADRQVGDGAQRGDVGFEIGGEGGAGAGDAGDRDEVEKAAGIAGDGAAAGERGGRGEQVDEVEAGGAGGGGEFGGFLGRQIDDQQAVEAGGGGVGAEPGASVVEDRIEVAEEDDGDLGGLAQIGDHREDGGEGGAGLEAAGGGALVGGSIRHRVGKCYTEFNEIGAARGAFENQAAGGGEVGIAGDEVGDERALTVRAQRAESPGDAARGAVLRAHRLTPKAWATVCISLSPRPERLTIMSCSRESVGASLIAWARAWADSRGGMRCSVSGRRRSASSAAAAVAGTYSARPVSWSQACAG